MPSSRQNPGVAPLADRTLELVDVPSESLHEAEIAALVERLVPLPLTWRDGESMLFRAPSVTGPLVVLAGHLDTVPAQGNIPGRIENGAVHGLGATDMKSGLAVMVELARWIAAADPALAYDVAFLFFPREELSAELSALPALLDGTDEIADARLVVVLEPTDNTLQLGCLGHVTAELVFRGESAHSARPWLGRNAIREAVEGLRDLVRLEPHDVEVQGLVFREVLSATRIEGGIATNVIPDEVRATLSFRYAPDRTPEEAEARLRLLVAPTGADAVVTGNSPAARVALDSPLVQRLRESGGFAVEPKQAWTPVAEFASRGLDAVNLGPGATRYAHRRDEQVEIAALERTFDALRRFLTAESK
jgi:succinyl-diaminopimelate desuccinylase